MKPPTNDKRVRPPREVGYARAFVKDWEKLSRSGRHNLRQLKEVMMLVIANDEPLGPEWKNHPLRGGWAGFLERHVGGDFLLVYEIDDGIKPGGSVNFVRAGSHSDLFNE